jgi:hypothetical protein
MRREGKRLLDPLIREEIRLSQDYDLFVAFVRSEKEFAIRRPHQGLA